MKNRYWICLMVLSLLATASCVKEEIIIDEVDFNITPEWGVPIARARIQADKLIEHFDEGGLIFTGGNGELSLVYRDTLDRITAGDLLMLEDQTFSETIDLSPVELDELFTTGELTVIEDTYVELESPEGDRLDSIRFSSGLLVLAVESEGSIPISGEVRIYSADDSEFLSFDFQDVNPPISFGGSAEFQNKLLLMLNENGLENGVRVEYEVNFTLQGSNTYAPIDINFSLTDFGIRSAGGYIAPRSLELLDQIIEVDLFNETFNGEIRIDDPRINVYFQNGFGLGLQLDINELEGRTTSGDILLVEGQNIADLPVVKGASFLGDVVESQITLNNQSMTPTISDFVSFQPNFISGDFQLNVNPSNAQNVFVSNLSALDISYDLEIPIYGSIADFLLIDTTTVELGDLVEEANETAEVLGIDVRLIVDNGFPLDAGVNIILTDSLFNPIETLFADPAFVFASADVLLSVPPSDPEYGRAISPKRTITEILIPKERVTKLGGVTHMIITVFGQTTSNGTHPIRLFSNDFFDAQVGAKVILNFNE